MIKFNGGGFGNMGILALATPTVNFAQKRADKDRALQYEALIASQKEQSRIQLQQEIAQQKAKYDEIRNLSVLAPDQNRINIVADELENAIKEKVKTKYGGNLQRYLQESADSDFEQYKKTIQSSDAYRDASSNKVNMAQYIEDQKAGKIPMMVGGRNVNDVLSDFQSGRTRQFTYKGGYMAPKDYAKRIQDSYGVDRFSKQPADPSRVILELQQDGLTLDQALDYYKQAGLDRNPIYHKYDDVYERQKMEQEAQARGLGLDKDKMSILRDQASIAKIEHDISKSKEDKRFYDVTSMLGQTNQKNQERDWNGGKAIFAPSAPLTRSETNLATDLANATFDEKTGLFRNQPGRTMLSADGTATIKGVSLFSNPRVIRRVVDPKNPYKDELYLQVDGLMDEASAEAQDAKTIKGQSSRIQSRFGTDDDVIGGSALIGKTDWFSFGNEDVYTIKDLLIPIDPSTVAGKAILNKKYGITGKAADAIMPEDINPLLEFYQD